MDIGTGTGTGGAGTGVGRNAARGDGFASTGFVKALGGALLWLAAAATSCCLAMTVMASDGCYAGDTRFLCTVSGQNVVAYVPLGAAPVAAVLGTWGLATKREPGWGTGAYASAWLLITAAWLVDLAITG